MSRTSLGFAGACSALGEAAGGGGAWAEMRGTTEMLPARKKAATAIPRWNRMRFHKNLLGTIAYAASSIRPRVYYDRVTVRRSRTGLAGARAGMIGLPDHAHRRKEPIDVRAGNRPHVAAVGARNRREERRDQEPGPARGPDAPRASGATGCG